MQPQTQVLVDIDEGTVIGLVLRAGKDGLRFLVTYEKAGRIETAWVNADRLRVAEETAPG